jgi:signal transduction histidine kinase
MVPGPIRVLLIDDDEDDYLLTRDLLVEAGGLTLDWAPGYEAGLEAVAKGGHDVVLLDYRLGGRTGLDLLREARRRGHNRPTILFTGRGEREIDEAAMASGAADFLEKSKLDATSLDRAIRYTLLQHRHADELERKVQERTRALERANAALQAEVRERTRAEEALREEARRKDEFLATLAHELRNPLAPIRNALEIMRLAGHNPAAVERGRAVIDRQTAHLVRLIDDLLDLSRLSRGKVQIRREPVELAAVVAAAVEIAQPLIEANRHQLRVVLPPVPVPLEGDQPRLVQVVVNLLDNAARYTEPGGAITLTAGPEADRVVIRVRDSGIGIAAEQLPRIFDMFTHAATPSHKAQGGLGIGLWLVRTLVEMHGGTVHATSAGPGQGSEFVVTLPVKAPDVGKR